MKVSKAEALVASVTGNAAQLRLSLEHDHLACARRTECGRCCEARGPAADDGDISALERQVANHDNLAHSSATSSSLSSASVAETLAPQKNP